MFNFLKPSPDATKLVPKEKVAGDTVSVRRGS